MAVAGAPRTETVPSVMSMSAGAASRSVGAASAILSPTFPAATWMELPAAPALREAQVPLLRSRRLLADGGKRGLPPRLEVAAVVDHLLEAEVWQADLPRHDRLG